MGVATEPAFKLFQDTLHPAELLLRIYGLLENDKLHADGELLEQLRKIVAAEADEHLLLLMNSMFVGIVRERAQMPTGFLKKQALENLLRQAIVCASTAMETYLSAMLRDCLPFVIQAKGRDFFPADKEVAGYFKTLTIPIEDVCRLVVESKPELTLALKIVNFANNKYLGSSSAVHTVGCLLTLTKPWDDVAQRLGAKKEDLSQALTATLKRRNDIVHRADRPEQDPSAERQSITFAFASKCVDAVKNVIFAFHEIVSIRLEELESLAVSATPPS